MSAIWMPGIEGGAIRLTDEIENPGKAQVIDIVSNAITIGTILTVAGNGTVDDAGIDLPHRFVIHTQPVDNTRSETFQHHIGIFKQAEKDIFSFCGL